MQDLSPKGIQSELTFFKAIEGDKRAIEEVILQWMPLVHKMANKYGWLAQANQKDDLVQEGRIAIMEAIRTYSPDCGTKPATWIWYKVRGKVQGFGNKQKKHPRFPVELEDADRNGNLEDPSRYELREDFSKDFLTKVLLAGCRDGLDSRRAQIVCSRFGLLGQSELRQGEVAEKFGLSKQAVNAHLTGFYKRVRKQMPELQNYI
ncbi:RNA polymerase sigma factor [Synechococcus phage S-CBWM1]|uniref:RNA polymerase sigma factor n=1 Tax=Synechococcus phage S-CBWM1 TaxID=2053653 RepID=A0A3G1L3S0_9CAUD|nr:RNA polymerase sigma factor [Synechococcus phage S-CBWM1]ATW62826.1 RNA polymerase sigma factor [Synechococcus phage S-CBWM1]